MLCRPAYKDEFQDILMRCCCLMQCQMQGRPFVGQLKYLAALRRDPSACDVMCDCMGLQVQGSGTKSREAIAGIIGRMHRTAARVGLAGPAGGGKQKNPKGKKGKQ